MDWQKVEQLLSEQTRSALSACTPAMVANMLTSWAAQISKVPAAPAPAATYSSAIIGASAEIAVENILSSKYSISNVSKSDYSTDLVIKSHNIRIEVKNYKNSVPREQFDKFLRDMSGAAAGIYISLTSKQIGVKAGWHDNYLVLIEPSAETILAAADMVVQWCEHAKTVRDNSLDINLEWRAIFEELDDLSEEYKTIQSIRTYIVEAAAAHNKQMSTAVQNLAKLEAKLQLNHRRITNSISKLPSNTLEPMPDPCEIAANICKKCSPELANALTALTSYNKISVSDNVITFWNDSQFAMSWELLKTVMYLTLPNSFMSGDTERTAVADHPNMKSRTLERTTYRLEYKMPNAAMIA